MTRHRETSTDISEVRSPTRQAARHSSGWPRPAALVIGSEPPMLDLLQLGFTYEGFDVALATNSAAALRSVASRQPDLILLHSSLPDCHQLIRLLRTEVADALTIVLVPANSQPDAGEWLELLEREADECFSQPFVFADLMTRVRTLLARRGKPIGGRLSVADVTLDRERHLVTRGERIIDLTLREFELLELFLRHPEQVLSRGEILEEIWGAGYGGSDNVLDVYIHLLRSKLGDKPARLIRTVRGVGYVLYPPRESLRVG